MDCNWTDAERALAGRMAGSDIISVRQFQAPELKALLDVVQRFEGCNEPLLAGRVLAYSVGDRQAEKPAAQVRLARAEVDLRAAGLLLDDCVRALDKAYGPGGEGIDRADRSVLRMATTSAVHTAKRAVTSLCDAAGGSAHLLDQPLQRFQRDLNTGVGHAVFDEDRAAETHGRILVGLEPGATDLL